MNPDSVSVLMTTAHVSGGAAASGPIRHLLSSGIQQFHKIRGRYFNADCATHASFLRELSSRPGAIYQQDNARPHTARLSQQCLQGYDVLPWPARSPDLSPIEHVCDALGRQLQPSRDTGELTAQMQRLWQDLPQGVISDLIKSMPRRISACIASRGGFTTY
ncbi:DDE_3 domain-containing protein [Trichonephila clavipes]|nr:DDE_3 domain-containing protein [Trichonephila clavipes]